MLVSIVGAADPGVAAGGAEVTAAVAAVASALGVGLLFILELLSGSGHGFRGHHT